MPKEKTELLKELVGKLSGKDSEVIVDIISGKKPVNEFKIAEKLGLTINQTRNILYKLLAQGIVHSVRKKDIKKGWYIYSWTMNYQKSLEKLTEIKKKEIYNFEHLLESRQNKRFYVCPGGCLETSEENAMLHEFKCPECGQLLEFKSFGKEIEELKEKIKKSKEEIAIIKVELDKISIERKKKDIREMEKKKKERKEKRALARKKSLKLKEKLNKKSKKESIKILKKKPKKSLNKKSKKSKK